MVGALGCYCIKHVLKLKLYCFAIGYVKNFLPHTDTHQVMRNQIHNIDITFLPAIS